MAISIEQANGRFLRQFADAFEGKDPQVSRRFRELAEEEAVHEEWLTEKFKRRFEGPVPAVPWVNVQGLEDAVEWAHPGIPVSEDLEEEEVFILALAAEKRASEFYRRAGLATMDKSLFLLFRQLVAMEKGHADWLKEQIQGMGAKNEAVGGKS